MIKVILVEDSDEKSIKILSELQACGIKEEAIVRAQSISDAVRELKASVFDLMLLDLHIPATRGGKANERGGQDLIEECQNDRAIQIPKYIVPISEYENILNALGEDNTNRFWGIINFSHQSNDWKKILQDKITFLNDNVERLNTFSPNRPYQFDVGVVCALEKELEPLLKAAVNYEKFNLPNDNQVYYKFTLEKGMIKRKIIACVSYQMGIASMVLSATKMINHFQPKYLATIGICAGMKDKVSIGDIVVADPSWDYSSGKISTKKDTGNLEFEIEPNQLRLHEELRFKFLNFSKEESFFKAINDASVNEKEFRHRIELKVAPFASGPMVVAHKDIPEFIKEQHRKTTAIDMETYGLMLAEFNSVLPKPRAFAMKAVCDFADDAKGDKFQAFACEMAAKTFVEFALSHMPL